MACPNRLAAAEAAVAAAAATASKVIDLSDEIQIREEQFVITTARLGCCMHYKRQSFNKIQNKLTYYIFYA